MTEDHCHQCHRLTPKTKLFWRRSPTQEPILLCHLCVRDPGRTTIRIKPPNQRVGKDGV